MSQLWSSITHCIGHVIELPIFTAAWIDAWYVLPVIVFTVPYVVGVWKERKIQKRTPQLKDYHDALSRYLTLHLAIRLLIYPILYMLPYRVPLHPLPSIGRIVWDCIKLLLLHDFFFFVQHYLMHTKYMYTHFHYVHHLYRAPFPLVSEVHHWVDEMTYVFACIVSTVLASPQHIVSFWLTYAYMQWHAVENHCGYDFGLQSFFCDWMCFAPVHDLHHLRVVGNFAPFFTFWDRMFDTYIGNGIKHVGSSV